MKEAPESPSPFYHVRTPQEHTGYEAREAPSPKHDHDLAHQSWISQPPELWEIHFVVYKLHSLCYLVIETQTQTEY